MTIARVYRLCDLAFMALVLAGASAGAVYGAALGWGWGAPFSGIAGLLLASLLGLAGTVPGGCVGALASVPVIIGIAVAHVIRERRRA